MTTETGVRASVLFAGEKTPVAVDGFSNFGEVVRWVTSDGYEVLVPWRRIEMVALEKTDA